MVLQLGEVDLFFCNMIWILFCDVGMGMVFIGVIYYDGIGFLTYDKVGLKSVKELDGVIVCIQVGIDIELNVVDYFKVNNMKYILVIFDCFDELVKVLEFGCCDMLVLDQL